jgi:hypothetical protein
MKIHFAVSHPANDRCTVSELEDHISRGELYLVTCRDMDFDFWDVIAVDEYDEDYERYNRHFAESAEKITSLSQIDSENLSASETYAIRPTGDDCYWTCTIVTDENLSEWEEM